MSEKQRGLGRGLSALLGEAVAVRAPQEKTEPQNTIAPQNLSTVSTTGGIDEKPIELLQRNPDQPRRLFAEAEIDDLAASIREKGVLQPILVRPAPNHKGQFQIIAGERRWRASQKAGLHFVPVIVREMDDLEVLEIAIVENVQREDLNAIEEAQAYKMLMERFGRTQDAVAQVVSKSRSHVANTMRLLSLPETIQDHVLYGRMSAGHARAIATAQNPEDLAQEIIQKGLSVRQAETMARISEGRKLPKAEIKARGLNADIAALEHDLKDALGLSVKLDDKGGKGLLTLSYTSLEQLDELCRRLMKG